MAVKLVKAGPLKALTRKIPMRKPMPDATLYECTCVYVYMTHVFTWLFVVQHVPYKSC